ncbi:MAG: IPTL-CTERM sorting domain-containing protein [Burkholderiaceae bacterium]|nr:IPTL-CTERM sorting domain-containing protein [Burkholderiaceae bacterium]
MLTVPDPKPPVDPQPIAPTPVPTLGEWGLVALSSLLAMFGLARSRRRSS